MLEFWDSPLAGSMQPSQPPLTEEEEREIEEMQQALKDLEEENDIRVEEEARAKGYANADEYEHAYSETLREFRHDKVLDEKCQQLNKTRSQLAGEDPQRWTPIPYRMDLSLPSPCACRQSEL